MLQALAVAALLALGAVSATSTTATYSGNGSTTAFPTGYKFIKSTDLVVTRTRSGVTTTLTSGVDYTVTGADSDSGGTVTFGVAPPVGDTIVITRGTSLNQTLSLTTQGPFPPKSIEDSLDKGILISQEAAAATTALGTRTGTLETEIAQLDGGLNALSTHAGVIDGEISTLQSTDSTQNGRLYTLESDVSTLLTASGFDLGAIYAAGHTWTAYQSFSVGMSATATSGTPGISASSATAFSAISASNSSTGHAIHITSGGELIDLGGLEIDSGGLVVSGATTLNSGLSVGTTGNSTAVAGTGHGLGAGALFVGGASGGAGIISQGGASDGQGGYFTGGDTNGIGVVSIGSGTGEGGSFTGGSSGGYALTATPGSGQSVGLYTTGDIKLAGGNPAATTGLTNQLTSANIIKAWANVSEGASPTIAGGFNVASASCTSNQITVTFATALADANYSAQAIRVGASATMWIAQQTTTTVKLAALDDAGSAINLCAGAQKVNVTVVGLQ